MEKLNGNRLNCKNHDKALPPYIYCTVPLRAHTGVYEFALCSTASVIKYFKPGTP